MRSTKKLMLSATACGCVAVDHDLVRQREIFPAIPGIRPNHTLASGVELQHGDALWRLT
jgi:hypothetical protein